MIRRTRQEATREALLAQSFVRLGHLVRDLLADHVALFRVDQQPLQRADQHVDDQTGITDGVDVLVQGHRAGSTDDLDSSQAAVRAVPSPVSRP